MGSRAVPVWVQMAVCLVLTACGTAGSGAAPPRPAASQSSAPLPSSLSWRPGTSFSASVNQQVTTHTAPAVPGAPPVTVQLAVAARQTLRVTSVRDGVADLEVRTTSWSWQHPWGSAPAGTLPAPSHLRVDSGGVILSGSYWSMPLDPPLPGVDFFSAGLAPGGSPVEGPWPASWQRTLADDTVLVCQAQGGLDAGGGGSTMQTSVHCPMTRRAFAADLSPDLIEGDVKALVRSAFDPGHGRVLGTSYASSFARRETTPGGAIMITGSVTTSIRFAY